MNGATAHVHGRRLDRARLDQALRESGRTFKEIMKAAGVPDYAVGEIFTGIVPGALRRAALARVLGVDADDLWPVAEASAAELLLLHRAERGDA